MLARGSLGMGRPNKQSRGNVQGNLQNVPSRQNALDKTRSREYEKTLVVQSIFQERLFHVNITGKFCLIDGLTSLVGDIHCSLYVRANSLKTQLK